MNNNKSAHRRHGLVSGDLTVWHVLTSYELLSEMPQRHPKLARSLPLLLVACHNQMVRLIAEDATHFSRRTQRNQWTDQETLPSGQHS